MRCQITDDATGQRCRKEAIGWLKTPNGAGPARTAVCQQHKDSIGEMVVAELAADPEIHALFALYATDGE